MTDHSQSETMLMLSDSNLVYLVLEPGRTSKITYEGNDDHAKAMFQTLSSDMRLKYFSNRRNERKWLELSSDTSLQKILANITSEHDVINAIRSCGLSQVADRLNYLCNLPVDEQHEAPIQIESLYLFAHFVMERLWLPYPQITVSPDGYINTEWTIEKHGDLAMEFMPSGVIRFSILYRSLNATPKFINGVQDVDEVIRIIKPFIDQLIP